MVDINFIKFIYCTTVLALIIMTPSKCQLTKIIDSCDYECVACNKGICNKCSTNYFLNKTSNTCVFCPEIQGCKQCSSYDSCQECDKFHKLNTTFSKCEQIKCASNPYCSKCESSGLCSECKPNYFKYNNICLPCPNCNNITCEGIQASCLANLPNNINHVNNENNSNTIEGCKKAEDNSTCINCDDGYYLTNSHCTKCEDSNCFTCDSIGKCLTCTFGFFLRNGKCLPCPSNCLLCNNSNNCDVCLPNFTHFEGECMINCQNSQPYCHLCREDNTCGKCAQGYFPDSIESNSLKCLKCEDDNCSLCTKNGEKCNLCKKGFALNKLNICVPNNNINCELFNSDMSCSTCKNGYIINLKTGMCEICTSLGHYILNNQCFPCTNKFTLCAQCTDGCNKCVENAEIINGSCFCVDNYFKIFEQCVNNLIIYSVLAIFAFILIFVYKIYVRYQMNRQQFEGSLDTSDEEDRTQDCELTLKTFDDKHDVNCVYGHSTEAPWKLNCGGYLCNDCSLDVINKITSKEEFVCPKCQSDVLYFNYINKDDTLSNTNEQSNNSVQINIENFLNNHTEDYEKCQICSTLNTSKVIKCGSEIPHRICSYCYNRIFLIEESNICPFCRKRIKV